MTIDIHKIITGNPITKNLMKPWGCNSNPNSLPGKLFNRYTVESSLIGILDLETKFNSKLILFCY